jgi:hypothetical protein
VLVDIRLGQGFQSTLKQRNVILFSNTVLRNAVDREEGNFASTLAIYVLGCSAETGWISLFCGSPDRRTDKITLRLATRSSLHSVPTSQTSLRFQVKKHLSTSIDAAVAEVFASSQDPTSDI